MKPEDPEIIALMGRSVGPLDDAIAPLLAAGVVSVPLAESIFRQLQMSFFRAAPNASERLDFPRSRFAIALLRGEPSPFEEAPISVPFEEAPFRCATFRGAEVTVPFFTVRDPDPDPDPPAPEGNAA
jgi:hypothetical protein